MSDSVIPARRDEELDALDSIAQKIEDNARDERVLARRVRRLRAGRAAGRSWHHLLRPDRSPRILELSTRILRQASEMSAALRRRLARGLRGEGATLPEIGSALGVTHQRVSVLLRDGRAVRHRG